MRFSKPTTSTLLFLGQAYNLVLKAGKARQFKLAYQRARKKQPEARQAVRAALIACGMNVAPLTGGQ